MYNILVVDDEVEIVELMEVYLTNDGYKVFKANSGEEALDTMKKNNIDLLILDIMMPGINGLQVCMNIRKHNNIPIIMLSAKSQDIDKIQGLSTGADDYMTKPFNPMELLARVKAQLRRYIYLNDNSFVSKEKEDNNIIDIKGLVINKKNHKVSRFGEEIKLTPTEYEILILLAENEGKIFNAEEIFKSVWNEKVYEANNTVMVHMWRLREKIEENPKEPKIIETVWGVGYKIEED